MERLQKLGLKIKKLIQENQFILYLFIFFIAFFIYLWIQSTPTFLDPDSFYHLKMAKLISERGPIINFPWLQFTVLKNYYIDHHFLYHVLAIPFVKLLGDFAGFKFYTVILATLFIFLSYLFFRKEKISYSEIFALALLFSPALMFRISLAKATAFSLILLFFGIYSIFKRQYWLLAIVSFLYVWSYGGFLLILLMTLIYALANSLALTFINKASWLKGLPRSGRFAKNYFFNFFKNLLALENLKIVFASFSGIILGIVINPYFPKNIKFYWQQLVEIGLINYRGLVNVGGEWYPYEILNLIPDSGVAFILAVVALILFIIFIKKQKAENIFLLIATFLFLFLTLKSKRYVEYFIPFLVYFTAFTCNSLLAEIKLKDYLDKLRKEIPVFKILEKPLQALLLIFILIMAKDAFITHQSFLGGIGFQNFAGISDYLIKNSKPGQIIMQTDWDDFPMLFYQNDKNYYIVGLDPTFMYNYDAKLYNLFADITTAKKTDNLYQAIKENFKASYFIVDSDRSQLARNLQNDGNFNKVYEDQDGSVYTIGVDKLK